MNDPILEQGMARVVAGSYLAAEAQPVACFKTVKVSGLGGFIVPDRAALRTVETTGEAYFASAESPFLTALTALPDTPLGVVSTKLLVAPREARQKGLSLKVIPMSFARAIPVTLLQKSWCVLATKSRVTRVTLEEGETLTVRPEALVAWIGKMPTGFCPKLRLIDIFLPRNPRNLALNFHGPATVWFEGSDKPKRRQPYGLRA